MDRKTAFERCFILMTTWFIIFLPVLSFGQSKASLSFTTQDAQKLNMLSHRLSPPSLIHQIRSYIRPFPAFRDRTPREGNRRSVHDTACAPRESDRSPR